VNVDVKVVARATGVLSDQSILVGLVDGALQDGSFVDEFASNVDIGSAGVHGSAGDKAAFDELVGVLSHDFTILAGSGFTLISVDDEVSRLGVLVPILKVHKRLHAGKVN
jgi:hypothetical protein